MTKTTTDTNGVDRLSLRSALERYGYEIAAELGIGEGAQVAAGEVRNANADPDAPVSSRTGRVTDTPKDR